MRRLLFIFIAIISAAPLPAAAPPLLETALQKISANFDHWAYTQTWIEKNDKGKVMNEAVVRFDPSKPYAEQFTPLKVDGKPPTAAHVRKYRRMGEKRAERIEKAETEGTTAARKSLGELMDIDHAALATEDAQTAIFEVPLKKDGNTRLPPEKFRVTARVNKEIGAFERIDVQLRSPMRTEIIVKIKSGEGHLDFATVDPKFAPALTAIGGSGAGSIMFVPIGRSYELKREDFRRVKPYADRFEVKLAPLKVLDY
jgi:hypothetical protein